MKQKSLSGFFENFLKKESLFVNKAVLQSSYTPDFIQHRDEQIKQVADILAPALKLERPSNIFIYGKTGTGKTLSIKYTVNQMQEVAEKNKVPLKVVYMNCKLKKIADTEYRLVAQLAREFKKEIPPTGLPTDEIYKIFFSALDKEKKNVLLVLDELDQLVKKQGDGILYNLTRINEELKNSQITIIGVSNDLVFADNLDPRVKSSLSEEEILFPPYNAVQIKDILRQRIKLAFRRGAIVAGAIAKCAAYAAREHGDARRALELLRVAAELAERSDADRVEIKHIDDAEEKIERDRILDIINIQPKQFQLTLYSILSLYLQRKKILFTGEIYELYREFAKKIKIRPLTQRRVSDIVSELDMLGIINAKVISKGRYGRTREISLITPGHINLKIKQILEDGLELTI